jgi:cytochrome c-type biogenesis protein CcmF
VQQFDTVRFASMDLMYLEPVIRSEANKGVLAARIVVSRDGKQVGVLEPALNDYFLQGQTIGTPSVATSIGGDLYLTIDRIDADGLTFKAIWFPYVWLVWAGGLLISFAPLLAWLLRRRTRTGRPVEEVGSR